MNIESQSGKLPKKDKGVGRKKKKVLDYTWINTLKDDEKDVVIKYYYLIFNENNIDADIKNIKEMIIFHQIPTTKNIKQNHIYLSAIIDYKTKFVTYELSLKNDTKLILNNISNTKFKNYFILHSDHGSAYSSLEYTKKIESLKGRISMSRIGNSLDNREIEYFFSILKS